MQHYKDSLGCVHFLEDENFEHLLPEGCIKISDGEAAEISIVGIVALSYADMRASEYPPVADYLDGIVKGDGLQIKKYIDDCNAVKVKYPKV